MIVTPENLEKVLEYIGFCQTLAIDTETTGLRPYHEDVLFSIIVSTDGRDFYFNFNNYMGVEPLPKEVFSRLNEVLSRKDLTVVFHNAKFDLAFLRKEGIEVKGEVLDIWTLDRLDYNDYKSYNLANVSKRHGYEKSDMVEQYITKSKLWSWIELPYVNRRFKDKRYNEVPFEIVRAYGEKDGQITFKSFEKIRRALSIKDQSTPYNIPKLLTVKDNEAKLTKTLFEMECLGVRVDNKYCKKAIKYYTQKLEDIKREFKQTTGHDFVKGSLLFKEIFKDEDWALTDKGNPKFDAEAMRGFNHPAAKIVVDYSKCKKQIEYFQGFIYFCDEGDNIHTNFKQSGTATGRLSSSEPNLQNLTKPDKYGDSEQEDNTFPVRRAFIPREGFFFAMLDYDQMEYRMMLDMAGAQGLIDKVLSGLDVHQATADAAGISRADAKTVNFSVLYGSGIAALAQNLGVQEHEAERIRNTIFSAAPEIKNFIYKVKKVASNRGYIRNFLGRRSYFKSNLSYKAPNYLIQGGCADAVKKAMNECADLLRGYDSRMIMTIHDELVFEIAYGEEEILPKLKVIMEGVYPSKRLPLTCGIDYSEKSLADKSPWVVLESNDGKKTGNHIQGKSTSETKYASQHMGSEDSASGYSGNT